MLAELLERRKQEVVRQLEARAAAAPGSTGIPEGELQEGLSGLLDDLTASLRRGGVDAPVEPANGRQGPDGGAWAGGCRLLGDCVFDLIEQGSLDASPRELRTLSDWLGSRVSAAVVAQAAQLREQNRRLTALLDAVPDPMSLISGAGRLLYLNRAGLEVAHAASGIPIDQITGRDWRELGYPPDFADQYETHLARAKAGTTVTTETLFPTPAGARWFEHKLSPVRCGGGSLVALAAISRDIHDRRGAQRRLQLLSRVSALAGTLGHDEILSAIARLSIPELADWCVVDVVEDGAMRRAEVAHRDPAKAALAGELRRLSPAARQRCPSGQGRSSGRSLLVPDCTGDALRELGESVAQVELLRRVGARSALVVPLLAQGAMVAVTTFAMTPESGRRYGPDDLALAEEMAKRAAQIVENAQVHRRLRESESRFRVALAHSNVSVFEKDSDLRLRWMYNPMFGKQPADVIGKSDADFFSPEEVAKLAALQRHALRTGERIRQEVRVSPRGERRHLLVHIEPLRDERGAVVGLTGAATDITDQKRAQEELAQALAFREQVLGILGHDLRNPLSAVRVLATLLLRREDLPEGVRASLWEIDRSGERMLEMIGTLLDFSESRVKETLPIAPVPMDVHEVCRSVVEELLAANPGRSIELDVEGDGRGRWDPARLAQVVSNLIGNALKHGAKHGPVRVSVGGDDGGVSLEVRNQGPAIPPELMRVLFEPFRQGPAARDASRSRGLGLGLFIVRQIVNAHGGAIAVESTDERGTTFTVRLPRAARVPVTDAHRLGWNGGMTAGP